jgi:hypothetical protein
MNNEQIPVPRLSIIIPTIFDLVLVANSLIAQQSFKKPYSVLIENANLPQSYFLSDDEISSSSILGDWQIRSHNDNRLNKLQFFHTKDSIPNTAVYLHREIPSTDIAETPLFIAHPDRIITLKETAIYTDYQYALLLLPLIEQKLFPKSLFPR